MSTPSSKRTARAEQSPGLFYLTRLTQLITGLTVASILSYFLYELSKGKVAIPYLFFLLFASSILTVISFIISSGLYCCHSLNVVFSFTLNGVLMLLWGVAFGLLTKAIRLTLALQCSKAVWVASEGITVCNLYKLLFSFTLIAFLATIGAFAHDVTTFRHQQGRGAYVLTEDLKPLKSSHSTAESVGAWDMPSNFPHQTRNEFEMHGVSHHQPSNAGYSTPKTSSYYQPPSYHHEPSQGGGFQQQRYGEYEVPSEQLRYMDTSYHH